MDTGWLSLFPEEPSQMTTGLKIGMEIPVLQDSLRALQRSRPEGAPSTTPQSDTITGNGRLRIRCPRCSWQPGKKDHWSCLCDYVWNTFDTGGVCPACGKVWEQTQCLRCHQWSRHDTWYGWEDEDKGRGRNLPH